MRFRLTFQKTPAMRFTGHLDLQHTWMRALRRAGIALEHSQGFHPLPKIQLASALPLGCTGTAEILDIWTEAEWQPAQLEQQLQAVLPPGIKLIQAQQIDPSAPKVQVALRAQEYLVELPLETDAVALDQRVRALLAVAESMAERRGKPVNIRPLIQELQISQAELRVTLFCRLSAQESATGRPDEVLAALGIDSAACQIERTRLIF
jgi:radical SAM-linked protein